MPPGKFSLTYNIPHLYPNTIEMSCTKVGFLCYWHFDLMGCLLFSICFGCLLEEFTYLYCLNFSFKFFPLLMFLQSFEVVYINIMLLHVIM